MTDIPEVYVFQNCFRILFFANAPSATAVTFPGITKHSSEPVYLPKILFMSDQNPAICDNISYDCIAYHRITACEHHVRILTGFKTSYP